MIEQAGLSAPIVHARASSGGRKVVGKPLLAVSASGMLVVVATLCRGNWPEAMAAFALTVGALQVMLHRALMQFDAPAAALAGQGRRIDRNAARPPTIRD
jgi:hypothetical protein